MPLLAFIIGLIGPVVVRVIIALGFTVVTFTGVMAAASSLLASAQASWAAVPLTVYQLASLTGFPEFLGLVFGATMSRLAIWASIGASRYIVKG